MYNIIETHIDVETGKRSEIAPIQLYDGHFGFIGRKYPTYEAAQKDIETFLVPHSVDLGHFENEAGKIDYNDGVMVSFDDGIPTTWTVLRNQHYHTEFKIRKAGS